MLVTGVICLEIFFLVYLIGSSEKQRKREIVGYVASLNVSPLKSAKLIKLSSAEIDLFGIKHDRKFVLQTEHGKLFGAVNQSRVVLIRQHVVGESLELNADGMEPLTIPLHMRSSDGNHLADVKVLTLSTKGVHVSDEADAWFQRYFTIPCKLYCFPTDGVPRYTKDNGVLEAQLATIDDKMMFNNQSPLMLLSEDSMEELNKRMGEPIHIDRFRPSIVIRACKPHEEDEWDTVEIGETRLKNLYINLRCPQIEISPEDGKKKPGFLNALTKYRPKPLDKFVTFRNGAIFGCYYGVRKTGKINVGDPVYKII